MRLLHTLVLAPVLLSFAALPAAAESWRAEYLVSVAGVTVMEAQVTFELDARGYRVESRIRTRGPANLVGRGEQTTRAEGSWRGDEAVPRLYATQGSWRGSPRATTIEYSGGEPQVRRLVPDVDMPRTPLPEGSRRGTIDALSGLARLARSVDRTARCDGESLTYDARRLTRITVRTVGQETAGLRCEIETRQIAGIPLERDPVEAARPQLTQAWFGRPQEGGPAVPLRVELSSRWWGRIEANLVKLERAAP